MIYARKLILPSERQEWEAIDAEQRTFVHTAYPFKIFPDKGLKSLEFDNISLLYGGNGSGKSTLINILEHIMRADRYTDFNNAPLFDEFTSKCRIDFKCKPLRSCVMNFEKLIISDCNQGDNYEILRELQNAL